MFQRIQFEYLQLFYIVFHLLKLSCGADFLLLLSVMTGAWAQNNSICLNQGYYF
jgi:hypothetical protein